MKKRIIKKLNSWGIYLGFQYKELEIRNKDLKAEMLALKMSYTSCRTYNEQLKKQVKNAPLNFNFLVNWYSSKQLNALVYEIVNHAFITPEKQELLPRWKQRIESAENALNAPKVDQDKITPSHFLGD